MKRLLSITALIEALTGLLILVDPNILAQLLFGSDLEGAGLVMSRIGGISLIALGIACWPGSAPSGAFYGMLAYSTVVTIYMLYIAIGGQTVGKLLWPAVAGHAILTVLLIWVRFKERGTIKKGGIP